MILIIVVAMHVLVSLLLILFILLHAGRGGGLSEMFGGGMSSGSLSGSTVMEKNLDRLTIGSAIVFALTTFFLVFLME